MEGKSHLITDALSRNPAFDPEEDPVGQPNQDGSEAPAICRKLTINASLAIITEAVANDSDYKEIIDIIQKGVRGIFS